MCWVPPLGYELWSSEPDIAVLDLGAELRVASHLLGAPEVIDQKLLGVLADAGADQSNHDVVDLADFGRADQQVWLGLLLTIAGPGHVSGSDVGDGFVAQAELLHHSIDLLTEFPGHFGLVADDRDLGHDYTYTFCPLMGCFA